MPTKHTGRNLDDTLDDIKEVAPLQRGVSSITRLGSSSGTSWAGTGKAPGGPHYDVASKAGDVLPTSSADGLHSTAADQSASPDQVLLQRKPAEL